MFGEDVAETTTTSTPPTSTAPSTTVAAPTTTTGVTPTTVKPVSTTTVTPTTVPPTTATITVKNDFSGAVKIAVGDETEHAWTLDPGEQDGPWTLKTATDHGDYMTITAVGTQCGYGDGEDYFRPGHEYELTAITTSHQCGDSYVPDIRIHDLTTNSVRCLGGNCLPRTG